MDRCCTISINDERTLCDIQLGLPSHVYADAIPDKTCLHFLSLVDTARIPLHLILGSPVSVHTSSAETEGWFYDVLLQHIQNDDEVSSLAWWKTARQDSNLGILVAVPQSSDVSLASTPRVTELLFYASLSGDTATRIQTPGVFPDAKHERTLSIYAVAISSDLLHQAQNEPNPPPSPVATDTEIEATFLPHRFPTDAPIINEPPVRKRKSATDVFDEASERRKKARRKGGEGVSATAASKADSQPGSLQHRRGHSLSQPTPLQTRSLSRSPSISSSRPPTAHVPGSRVSTLSRVQSASAVVDATDVETKNKNLISRIVMAGMRLYGLSQSKSRRSRANSSAPSPVVDASFETIDAERKKNEEFKLIYHQAFKGTCFAFRAALTKQSLHASSDAIQDVADRLLAIFCNDSLDSTAKSGIIDITRTGKEAFTSVTLE